MSTDFQTSDANTTDVRKRVLQSVSSTLESRGKHINVFHLLDSNVSFDEEQSQCKEISDELAVAISEDDLLASGILNSEQLQAYNEILQKVFSNETAVFFIDGPGGTGKIFLYKSLIAKIRYEHLIALATASSSVVASILPGTRFKIPLDAEKNTICIVSKQSGLARLLRLSRLIVWDEAPMSRKESVEAFDKMLRDINNSELLFGGKIVIFGGDFHQVLLVVRKGTRQEEINASLADSYLWPMMKKITLSENMRARLDLVFSEYLLQVGNGTSPITIEENIKIANEMLIPYTNDLESLENLIDGVDKPTYN